MLDLQVRVSMHMLKTISMRVGHQATKPISSSFHSLIIALQISIENTAIVDQADMPQFVVQVEGVGRRVDHNSERGPQLLPYANPEKIAHSKQISFISPWVFGLFVLVEVYDRDIPHVGSGGK